MCPINNILYSYERTDTLASGYVEQTYIEHSEKFNVNEAPCRLP